ncbi:MAG: sensor histidine kinase [Nitrospiraceae bacterium]
MSTYLAYPTTAEPLPNRRQSSRRNDDRRLLQRERELEAARRICEALSQHVDIDKLVERALRTALEVVGAEAGSVLLADRDAKQLVFRHVIGLKADQLRGTVMPSDLGIAGVVFKSGKPLVISDVKQDGRHFPYIDELTGYRTRDIIVAPLKRWEGEPIGVLEILNKREGRLDDDDIAMLTIVSALTATMIEQARLFQEAKLAEVVRLLGDIGHDIKNLLVPVVFGAELVQTQVKDLVATVKTIDPGKAQASQEFCDDVMGMLLDDARRIDDRVTEIADCVKGLSSPPRFAPCRVADVVDNVLKPLRFLAEEKGVSIRTEGLESLPLLLADGRRLYNAFYNLVNNAIPEVPPRGSITVGGRLEPAAGMVLLSVADTGRGMPPDIRDSLFTAQAISRKVGGTGLGTKIVKDVVDAHGGQITVDSKEGVGTTFLIRLPLPPLEASSD